MPNLQDMMGQMKKMQAEIQQQLEALRVEATAGGGMVKVTMNGSKRLLSVKLEPEAVKSGDVEMLEDLFLAAVKEAGKKKDEGLGGKVGGVTGGPKKPRPTKNIVGKISTKS